MSDKLEELHKLIQETDDLRKKANELDTIIFARETKYIKSLPGNPIYKDTEYYITGRTEKKKASKSDNYRVFAKNYPRS